MPPTWHTQSPGQSWPWRWMPTITTGGWPCSKEPLGQSGSLSHSSAGSLASDVAAWCKECTACNKAKVTVQPAMMVENMDIPAARFSHVHVDILRPLPLSHEGYTHLLTMIDRSTHWPVAVLLRVTTAEAFVDDFVGTWLAHFGMPSVLITDRRVQFTSAMWGDWCTR